MRHVKNNIGLVIICSVAVILHIYPISSPIYLVGDEALFIQGGLWIYDYFGAFWHEIAKYTFWVVIILALILSKKKSFSNDDAGSSGNKAGSLVNLLLIFSVLCLLVIYFILIRNLPFNLSMLRYPPLQKLLYLVSYFLMGIEYIGPRLVQLIFYILSAVYLYRIINLFSDKETSLLGASIYLFSPIVFDYAHFAELACGVVFFIILVSYYFLRFLIYKDNRGLLLSSYFIGAGFLYKRDIFLMFFICCAYIILYKLKNRELRLNVPFKILSLSLVPIIPWMIIGNFFNWRNAGMSLSQFTSFDKVTAWVLMIPASVSWGVFFIFLLSILFVLVFKRDTVTLFFGLLFACFYVFYTAQYLGQWIRMSSAFYPTIAIFLALFIQNISNKIKWKHSFKTIYFVLTCYMIVLCTVPPLSAKLITYKDVKAQYFPNEKAMQWVRDNVKDGERILSLRFKPDLFYGDKYGIDKNKIISRWYDIKVFSTPEKLKAFCIENKASFILFPDGPSFLTRSGDRPIIEYLKENRNKGFIEIAKFSLKENYIYIYKLKNNRQY
jgi:hypothetical protein